MSPLFNKFGRISSRVQTPSTLATSGKFIQSILPKTGEGKETKVFSNGYSLGQKAVAEHPKASTSEQDEPCLLTVAAGDTQLECLCCSLIVRYCDSLIVVATTDVSQVRTPLPPFSPVSPLCFPIMDWTWEAHFQPWEGGGERQWRRKSCGLQPAK